MDMMVLFLRLFLPVFIVSPGYYTLQQILVERLLKGSYSKEHIFAKMSSNPVLSHSTPHSLMRQTMRIIHIMGFEAEQ